MSLLIYQHLYQLVRKLYFLVDFRNGRLKKKKRNGHLCHLYIQLWSQGRKRLSFNILKNISSKKLHLGLLTKYTEKAAHTQFGFCKMQKQDQSRRRERSKDSVYRTCLQGIRQMQSAKPNFHLSPPLLYSVAVKPNNCYCFCHIFNLSICRKETYAFFTILLCLSTFLIIFFV